MTTELLHELIESLVSGSISPEDHDCLQKLLKSDAKARALFRERMDLEAGLVTWAAEESDRNLVNAASTDAMNTPRRPRRRTTIAVCVAVAIVLAVVPWLIPDSGNDSQIADESSERPTSSGRSNDVVGTIRQQDCMWKNEPKFTANRFTEGSFSLTSGVAELSFNSGTNVTLEAPCEFDVASADSARVLSGNVFVDVTEVSNGFSLRTPEAEIIDEGTSYAVSLSNESTEVHVFDGSVIWAPDGSDFEDRIEAGEATLFLRGDPTRPKHIPFGQRQFVRRIEAEIKAQSGDSLIAYDGFENLAGHLRRGRSGFGWNGGWQSGRRGRGQLAEVTDAPDERVFGKSRSGRRLLKLAEGDSIARTLEAPLVMGVGSTHYVSLLITKLPGTVSGEQFLQVLLGPETAGRRRRQVGVLCGITDDGFPFINAGNDVRETASSIHTKETYLCVLQLVVSDEGLTSKMRLYGSEEAIDEELPETWTVVTAPQQTPEVAVVHVSVGDGAVWLVDELKVGTEWRAVTRLDDGVRDDH